MNSNHPGELASTMISLIENTKSVLTENLLVKFVLGTVMGIFGAIYDAHEPLIRIMFLLFIIDFVLGFSCAFKRRDIESKKVFGGAIKLIVYGVLLVVAFSVDSVLKTGTGFTWGMFVFIILRDAVSILENLEYLFPGKTPDGLRKALKKRAQDIFSKEVQ